QIREASTAFPLLWFHGARLLHGFSGSSRFSSRSDTESRRKTRIVESCKKNMKIKIGSQRSSIPTASIASLRKSNKSIALLRGAKYGISKMFFHRSLVLGLSTFAVVPLTVLVASPPWESGRRHTELFVASSADDAYLKRRIAALSPTVSPGD